MFKVLRDSREEPVIHSQRPAFSFSVLPFDCLFLIAKYIFS